MYTDLMKYIILSLLVLSTSLSAWSQKTAQGTGPYKESERANLAQKIIHLLDNSTIGAVQTVLGASHILVFGILNPIKGEDFGLGIHNNEKSEVSQIIVDTDAINAGAYSLGLFQVGNYAVKHEGGHSVASATLGPLYLPMVGLSYLVEGYYNSLFETWADMEADPEGYMNTSSGQIGLGSTMFNGQRVNVVVMKFSIEQRQMQQYQNIHSDKIFEWANTKIVAPLIEHTGQDKMPFYIEFDLLKKNLNIVVDNLSVYLGADQKLRSVILTEQRYLHIENNQALKQVHFRALDWSAQYGLQYNLGKILTVTPRIGIGLSVGGVSGTNTYLDNYTFNGSFSFIAGLDAKLLDYATLTGQYQREYYTNGVVRSTWSAELHNEHRDPFKKIGYIQYLEFGAGYKEDKWETPSGQASWSQWNATLGLRF